jgi:hypothetical protein
MSRHSDEKSHIRKAHIARCNRVVLFAENNSKTKDATTVFMVKILLNVCKV